MALSPLERAQLSSPTNYKVAFRDSDRVRNYHCEAAADVGVMERHVTAVLIGPSSTEGQRRSSAWTRHGKLALLKNFCELPCCVGSSSLCIVLLRFTSIGARERHGVPAVFLLWLREEIQFSFANGNRRIATYTEKPGREATTGLFGPSRGAVKSRLGFHFENGPELPGKGTESNKPSK